MTLRTKLAVISTLLGLSLSAVNYGVNNLSMAPPTKPEWEIIPRVEAAAGSVTVRFTGSTTLLFDDGETSWMTDGWFSRPTFIEIITERVEPVNLTVTLPAATSSTGIISHSGLVGGAIDKLLMP